MTDPIALQAENDALRDIIRDQETRIGRLQGSQTIPAPPPTETDTGGYSKDKALAELYLAVAALKEHIDLVFANVAGRVEGLDVDIAQSQAFEARTGRALQSIDSKLDALLGFSERVVILEDWRRRTDRACGDCPNRAAL